MRVGQWATLRVQVLELDKPNLGQATVLLGGNTVLRGIPVKYLGRVPEEDRGRLEPPLPASF